MAKGSPSLIALLGLLAVAGYQNRDRLGSMLTNASPLDPMRQPQVGLGQGGAQGGLMDSLHSMFGQSGGGNLMGGLSELFDRFANPVQKAKVDSWVQRGPNAPLSASELEEALDEETLAELGAKTGLSREELLSRLSTTLPDAVDQVTPDGQFPPVSMQEPRTM